MRIHKWSIILSGLISITSLGLSILFNYYDAIYMTNLLIGIFASGILVFATSIVQYLISRKAMLYKLYSDIYELMSMIGIDDLRRDCRYDVYELRANIKSIVKFFGQVVFMDFQEIALFRREKKTLEIVKKIHKAVCKVYNGILDDDEILNLYVLGDIEEKKIYEHEFYKTKKEAVADVKLVMDILEEMRIQLNFYKDVKEDKNEQ